jgi:hypothetical protein
VFRTLLEDMILSIESWLVSRDEAIRLLSTTHIDTKIRDEDASGKGG